jgi:TP901 family phage tail tape measure protein
MAEIKQQLGIDVSQAIRAIDSLNRRLDQFGRKLDGLAGKLRNFNRVSKNAFDIKDGAKNLDKLAGSTNKVVKGFAGFSGAAKTTAQSTSNISSNLNTVGNAAQTAAQNVGTFGSTTQSGTSRATAAFNRLGAVVRTTTGRAGGAIKKLGTGIINFGQGAATSIGKLTLGFRTLAKIISTQAAIRGLNALAGAFTNSISSAIDFQRQIAEIQTIAQGSFKDFGNAASKVRELSDAFNVSLGDVGEGLYQTISNQIQGTANQVDVLTNALILSKVGVASTADSVSLLTGTLNSFQLEGTEAERVSAILFKTVELGRTRISELANSFGTVSTLAAEAGASVEELAAAFAAVTINGVNTAKAATQIRGIFNALIKPTEALKKVFEEAGLASGQQAIESLGLAKTIQLISDAAGGSTARLAELIPRLRGITAQLVLGRNAGEQFTKAFEGMQRAAEEGIQEEFEIIIETNAEAVTRVLNRLSNALTVDLGQGILAVLGPIARMERLVNILTATIQVALPPLGLVTAAVGLYAIAAGVAALSNLAFGKSFLVIAKNAIVATTAVVAVGVAIGAGLFLAARASSARANDAIVKDSLKASRERRKIARQERREILRNETAGIRERIGQITGYLAEIRIQLSERVKEWEDSSDKIKRVTAQLFDDILDANRALVDRLKSGAKEAADAQIASQQRVADIRQSIQDRAFNNTLRGRDPIAKSFLQQRRAAEQALEAAQALSTATEAGDVDSAVAAADRARSTAEEAVQSAITSGNRAAITRAMRNQLDIDNQILAAEQKQQRIQAQREFDLTKAAAIEEGRVRELEAQIQRIIDLQSKFGPKLSPIEQDDVLEEVQAALLKIGTLKVPKGKKLTAGQLIDQAKFNADILQSFAISEAQGVDIEATLTGESLKQLGDDIQSTAEEAFSAGIRSAISSKDISADAVNRLQALSKDAGPIKALDALVDAINAERDQLIQIEKNKLELANSAEELADAGKAAADALNRSNTFLENTAKALTGLPAAVIAAGEAVGLGGGISGLRAGEQLGQLRREVTGLPERVRGKSEAEGQAIIDDFNKRLNDTLNNLSTSANLFLREEIAKLNKAVEVSDKAIRTAFQKGNLTAEQIREKLDGTANTAEQKLKPALNESAQSLSTGAEKANDLVTNLGNAVDPANQIAAAAIVTADKLKEAATSSKQIGPAGGAEQQVAFGGKILRLAEGGFTPRGTDTVPAMLSPGEFVVNARSTRKFFSQLQAINTGSQPRFFQDGGSVTNFGDVNVNMTSSQRESGQTTGREVARSIQRELRRKTSSFRR